MNNGHPMKRRKFLRTGLEASLLATVPFLNLLTSSTSEFGQYDEQDRCYPNSFQDKIQEISLKYGGEFAGVKPELRRNSHGCV